MDSADALAETEQMTAVDMSAALSAMKPHQAADIIQVSTSRAQTNAMLQAELRWLYLSLHLNHCQLYFAAL